MFAAGTPPRASLSAEELTTLRSQSLYLLGRQTTSLNAFALGSLFKLTILV